MTLHTRILLVLFVFGALLRGAAIFDQPFVVAPQEARDLHGIACAVGEGYGFARWAGEYTAYYEPFIPMVSSGVLRSDHIAHYWFFYPINALIDDSTVLCLIHVLADLLTALLLYLLARARFSARVGVIAAAAWVFYPAAILFTAQFLPDTFFALFTVFSIWLYDRLEAHGWSVPYSVALGLCLGLIVLVKSVGLILLVAYTIYIVLLRYETARWPRVISGFVILFSALAVFVPWMIRNAHTLDYFALNTRSGTSLYMGNHVGATGGELELPRPDPQLSEVQLDIVRWHSAWDYLDQHREAAAELWPRKFALLWNTDYATLVPRDFREPLGHGCVQIMTTYRLPSKYATAWSPQSMAVQRVLLFALPFIVIVLVGTAGIFLVPHFGTRGLFILLLFLTGVVAMVTYGSPRDHFACMPALILSGCAVIRPRSWSSAPEWRRTFLLAFLGLFGGIWIYELLQGLGW